MQQIKDSLTNAKQSSQSGDWAQYGQYLQQLENLINQLETDNISAVSEPLADEAAAAESTADGDL